MVLGIADGFIIHLTTHGFKISKMFHSLDYIPVKALPARCIANVTLWAFFPFSTTVNSHKNKFNCLDMDRKWIHKNDNLGNIYSFQKSRKY